MMFSSAGEFEKEFPFQKEISEQIRFLLQAAIRAPSTHNSQPWRFRIESGHLFVYRDTRISLPQSDSVNRYAHISIGFLLHHIVSLGTWLSMEPRLVLCMEDERIAEITFSKAEEGREVSPTVEAIFKRKNRRGIFEMKTIPQDVLASATHVDMFGLSLPEIKIVTDHEKISHVADATAMVMRRVYTRAPFRREMAKWITPTGLQRRDGIPGYSLNQPVMMSWVLPTLIRFVNMGKVLAGLNKTAIASAPAAFGFGAPDNPSGWVSVGYAASHVALTLVASGFDYSVFVASVEYEDTRQSVGEVFGLHQPLEFFFVAGILPGMVSWMTPRVPVDDKLIPS
ncbi:MAG: nitroreductase family protein [Minisyncoccota bacterium]